MLPLLTIAARIGAKAASGAARGTKAAGKRLRKGAGSGGDQGQEKEKPTALSPEGIAMLAIAGVLEVANVIIGFLDFAYGIGLILGPVVNIVGTALIGGWLWIKFGKLPLKKALVPLIINSIPFAKFLPWWLLSVATSLEWTKVTSQPAQAEPPKQQATGASSTATKNPA